MNGYTKQISIVVLITNEKIRNYIIKICKKNNLHPLISVDLEELIQNIKKMHSAVVMIDYEVITSYGARIYSIINVVCPGCKCIMLCNQDHRNFIKEAVEHGVYACILAPYAEWEVLTMIRSIIAKNKLQDQKKPYKNLWL